MAFDAISFVYAPAMMKSCRVAPHFIHTKSKKKIDRTISTEPIIASSNAYERLNRMKRRNFMYRRRYNPTQQISIHSGFFCVAFLRNYLFSLLSCLQISVPHTLLIHDFSFLPSFSLLTLLASLPWPLCARLHRR